MVRGLDMFRNYTIKVGDFRVLTVFLLIFLMTGLPLMDGLFKGIYTANGLSGPRKTVPSLDGEVMVEDIASGKIIGESSTDSRGLLGSNMGHADVNNDGIDDLFISAPGLRGLEDEANSGICYIWYGSETVDIENIDLDTDSPDIVIKGSKLDSKSVGTLRAGDFDGDGNTDIVIGNPDQPESGKVFILWGSGSSWPSQITLPPVEGNEPNGNPVGFLRTNDYLVVSGFVTTSVLGRKLGQEIEVGDLDNDTYDDVVFSFHGWRAVMIIWGGPNRLTIGDGLTYLQESTVTSMFGVQVEIGDLNDDGSIDMVVSAPNLDDDSRGVTRAGAIYVYYGIGKAKGNSTISSVDPSFLRPRIWGTDPYDNLGVQLTLMDVNNDMKDDILIGIPGDDGPQNNRMDCGQIQIIYGDDITSFPSSFIGSSMADVLIFGENGKSGDIPGDSIGDSFGAGDIDGDGEMELLISFPSMDNENGDMNYGMVSLYETRNSFNVVGGISDLSKLPARMKIWGMDPEDNLGQGLTVFDLNGDGVDDILLSASSADGDENQRSGCGEVFLITGNTISIGDLSITGAGTRNGNIYSGLGKVIITVPILKWPSADVVEDVYLHMDPEGYNITFHVDSDFHHLLNDPYGTITLDEVETRMDKTVNRATVKIVFITDLFFKLPDLSDILVTVATSEGEMVERRYSEELQNLRDLRLFSNPTIERNGEPTLTINDWFTQGDILGISGLQTVYEEDPSTIFQGNPLKLSLLQETNELQTIDMDEGWKITYPLDLSENAKFSLSLDIDQNSIPSGYPIIDLPSLGKPYEMNLRIDGDRPSPPSDVKTIPDEGRYSGHDDDSEWMVEWNETIGMMLDQNSSGVHSFQVSVNGSDWETAYQKGGLWVTYFRGRNFQEIYDKVEGVDPDIDHPRSEWGQFAPVTDLYYKNYSIRYHGWFLAEASRDHVFGLTGSGAARLIIDGRTVIDSNDIATTPISNPVYLTQGQIVPIILLFQNSDRDEGSWLTLRMEDSTGSMEAIGNHQLLYPSNRTMIDVPTSGNFPIEVISIDWVGLKSDPYIINGGIDDLGPRFDLSLVKRWYPTTHPSLEVRIQDPSLLWGDGAGLDIDNIYYRIKPSNDVVWTDWTKVTSTVEESIGPDGPSSVISYVQLELNEAWRGSIQFKAADMVGNTETSSILDFGIDLNGPDFEVLVPNLLIVQNEGDMEFLVKVIDRPGAGVSGPSVEMRYSFPGTDWSIWFQMNGSGVAEELVASLEMYLPAGNYQLQFRAEDALGNSAVSEPLTLKVEKKLVDMPPIPVISFPIDGVVLQEGTPVVLNADGSSDDGLGRYDDLVYTWFSNLSGLLGVGPRLSVYLKELGMHRITLYLDDGSPGHNMSTFVNITMESYDSNPYIPTVNDTNEDNPIILVLAVSGVTVLVLAILFIVLLLRYKKKKEDEIVLAYKEKTEDDIFYEQRIQTEERELGIEDQHREMTDEEIEKERASLYGDPDN